jgi:MFS transporter, DHA3 family, macrolide efflux protein
MINYFVLWIGQLISMVGTSTTSFALTIWAWQETGQATTLALAGFLSFFPVVIISPFAGVFADRWSRKVILIVSDSVAGVATLTLLLLYVSGNLAIWHIYVLSFVTSVVGSFQYPAMAASIRMLVPEKHRSRANGMRSVARSVIQIGTPVIAGILLASTGYQTIFIIDIVTFCIAVLTLTVIKIPQPKRSENAGGDSTSVWKEAVDGLQYIIKRRSLFSLTMVGTFLNFLGTIGFVVLEPMILARTSGSQVILGSVLSALAVGGIVGGLIISIWGGPKRKIYGVVLGIVGGSLSLATLGLGQNIIAWSISGFVLVCFMPMVGAFSDTIMQNKILPSFQGRYFASSRALSQIGTSAAYLVSGFLADHLFEPSLMPGGVLTGSFGWLVGTGPGAGMGLMIVFSGLLGVAIGIVAIAYKPLRKIEDLLPNVSEDEEVKNTTNTVMSEGAT